MKRFFLASILSLAAVTATAQGDPIATYLISARLGFKTCAAEASLAEAKNTEANRLVAQVEACISRERAALKPHYDSAIKSAEGKQGLISALKDHAVEVLEAFKNVYAEPGESWRQGMARQDKVEARLSRAASRVEIEK